MKRGKGKAVVLCLLALLLCVGAYASYRLYASHRAYRQGDLAYEQIMQQVLAQDETPATPASHDGESAEEPSPIDIPAHAVDFTALKSISTDAAAWLYCPDTVIDYPVMATQNNAYYLGHLPDGTKNLNGSLFLDYRCSPDFSDQVSVIYGHNMKSKKMFGSLSGYKEQDYYDEHPYLYLYTETQNYRLALLYGAVITAEEWSQSNFLEDGDGLLAYAKANTTFQSQEEYKENERLVVLSTCTYEYYDARYILVGVLQPGY
jgi:sortase B